MHEINSQVSHSRSDYFFYALDFSIDLHAQAIPVPVYDWLGFQSAGTINSSSMGFVNPGK